MKTIEIKPKRLAVVASGWHFPAAFYEAIVKQKVPSGWQIDLFCISHRDPVHAHEEKRLDEWDVSNLRERLDSLLYSHIATVDEISGLGWDYKEHPNTVGDWGNTNQWLEGRDFKDYDLFLFTHDDNLIIHDRLFADIIDDPSFEEWDILTNSIGQPQGTIRGSFEFFKPRVLDIMGGKFDLSTVSLNREGETKASNEIGELNDWNNITTPLHNIIEAYDLTVSTLSPCYRVSAYCIEGERGYISKTHGANTALENAGLKYLHDNGII